MAKPFSQFGGVCLAGLAVLSSLSVPGDAAETKPRAVLAERHRKFLEEHCQGCHGAEKQKGKFRLDDLPLGIGDVATAERWQKVLNAMNSGEMPPEEEKQPDKKRKADFLEELSQVMVVARKALADQHGVIAMRRLNRREYRNTLRELLGVEVDVSELPADTGGSGFDTVGAGLFLTSTQFEQYEAIGREALDAAFSAYGTSRQENRKRVEMKTLLPIFDKKNREGISARERAHAWIQAVDAAAARPENAAKVAELRQIAKSDDALRYHWKKIPGAPSVTEFGFPKSLEVNPAGVYLHRDSFEFIAYDAYYRQLPHLDRGAYLTHPSRVGGGNNVTAVPSLAIPSSFPPGNYTVRVRVAAVEGAPESRRFLEFGLKGFAGEATPALSTHSITGTLDAPQVLEIPFTLPKSSVDRGHRNLFIRERGATDGRSEQRIKEAQVRNGFGPEVALWVEWMEIEERKAQTPPPGIRALGIPVDEKADGVAPARLRLALERFVVEAYRGVSAPAGMVDRVLGIYTARQKLGDGHREALKHALAAVLSSPRFLFRAEPSENGDHRPLTGLELATRLSYFLQGGPPDDALRAAATRGELLRPEGLRAQTERLLNSPESMRFVRPFLTQWLGLDRLDLFQFSKALYPRFDDAVRSVAREEVLETYAYLLRENAPLTDLLSADYVVTNALLAEYYGLSGVRGDAFRKVLLPAGSPRGGLLGMAAILAMGSNGQRTNPVERGAWVLRKLLHEPPPPAPANVPEIARLAGKALTTRERLQAHQEEPQCASCHRKIDPIGFGLENFDAAGQWRTKDTYQGLDAAGKPDPKVRKTWTIEASATLHKGPSFKDYFELKEIVAGRRESFARGFTSALIEYALGRPCGFSDDALVDGIVRKTASEAFAARSFIHALVQSKPFQSK
ncbi:MAG: hypothetical protein RLZZ142_906 [Verrucomicrobiota bacterium]